MAKATYDYSRLGYDGTYAVLLQLLQQSVISVFVFVFVFVFFTNALPVAALMRSASSVTRIGPIRVFSAYSKS